MASLRFLRYPKVDENDISLFLSHAKQNLEWGELSEDIVMDIGYDIEDNSAKQIVTVFPNVRKIVAVERKYTTLSLAIAKYSHPKIEYCVADIKYGCTLTPWLGQMSKVISVNSFTSLEDQTSAFENIYNLLVPGGEAVLLFCFTSGFYSVFTDIIEEPRWKKYFQGFVVLAPESHIKKLQHSDYWEILRKIGFEVRISNNFIKRVIFESENSCKDFLTDNTMILHIPEDEREEFKQDLFKLFLKHNTQISPDEPEFSFIILATICKKL